MDIEKLIVSLRSPSWQDLEDPDAHLLEDAAHALSTLQAENKRLKNKLSELAHLPFDGPGIGERTRLMAENAELRAELEQVKRERDAAVEDLHKLCPAWKWDGEPSNLLTVPFTAGRQTPGCGLFRLSGSTARRRDRYIGNGGDQNGATDI